MVEDRAPYSLSDSELVFDFGQLTDDEKRAAWGFVLATRTASEGSLEARRLPDGSFDFYHVRKQRVAASIRKQRRVRFVLT